VRADVPTFLIFSKVAFESEGTAMKICAGSGQSKRKTGKSLREEFGMRI
jgi:hypothetical protein